jgi:integrase
MIVDGEAVPSYRAAVRFTYTAGELGLVKTGHRYRTVPMSKPVVAALSALRRSSPFSGPDDYVFVNRAGGPVDAHNISNRIFRKTGKALLARSQGTVDRRFQLCESKPGRLHRTQGVESRWADYDSRWGAKINWHSFRHTAATWQKLKA